MLSVKELQAQYVTNEIGKKVAIILPIEEFQELLDGIDDLAVLAERLEEPTIPHVKVMARLKRDGLLPG